MARPLPRPVPAVAAAALGVALGLGAYTFLYAKGYSYLGHSSTACANCHAMSEQYAGWMRGSHRQAAQCADCHTPFNPVGKYAIKAWDGFWHSYYFTTGAYPDNIQITPGNHDVAEASCQKCHSALTQTMSPGHGTPTGCVKCHGKIGHPK